MEQFNGTSGCLDPNSISPDIPSSIFMVTNCSAWYAPTMERNTATPSTKIYDLPLHPSFPRFRFASSTIRIIRKLRIHIDVNDTYYTWMVL